ncbi:MAG: replicative DNA helicase [Abditibacteriota bacterium]|nr:replicative DNA helicase [Abditibacteriota bacterium]
MADAKLREQPRSFDAEQCVLGSMLMSDDACDAVIERLKASDFYHREHQLVFEALLSLVVRNIPRDLITVSEELKKNNAYDKVGGAEYLTALWERVPVADNVGYYADIVAEKSTLRKLIAAGTDIVAMAYESDEEAKEVAEKAEKRIFEITEQKNSDNLKDMKTVAMDFYRYLAERNNLDDRQKGVMTGYLKLDEITSGLQPSNLVIVAARPAMGKTSFALGIALHAALSEKKTVAVFSLEMSTEEVIQRIMSSRAKVEMGKFRRSSLKDNEWERVTAVSNELFENNNIWIDDSTEQSHISIRSKCRRVIQQAGKLDLIVVDYLQLMKTEGKRPDNRVQEVSEIVRGLKSLAREMKCPVVALAQLSRKVEERPDKRPVLSDLRESGSIEADADVVLMLHRPAYYEKKGTQDESDPDEVEEATVLVGKHRNGATGPLSLGFIPHYATFVNLAEEYSDKAR